MEKRIQYFTEMRDTLNEKEKAAREQWCIDNGLPIGTRRELVKQGVPDEKLPPRNLGLSDEEIGIVKVGGKCQSNQVRDEEIRALRHVRLHGAFTREAPEFGLDAHNAKGPF